MRGLKWKPQSYHGYVIKINFSFDSFQAPHTHTWDRKLSRLPTQRSMTLTTLLAHVCLSVQHSKVSTAGQMWKEHAMKWDSWEIKHIRLHWLFKASRSWPQMKGELSTVSKILLSWVLWVNTVFSVNCVQYPLWLLGMWSQESHKPAHIWRKGIKFWWDQKQLWCVYLSRK